MWELVLQEKHCKQNSSQSSEKLNKSQPQSSTAPQSYRLLFYKCDYWFCCLCFLVSLLHTHPIPNWKPYQRASPPGASFKGSHHKFSPVPSQNFYLLFYSEWKLPNWATIPKQSTCVPTWKQRLFLRGNRRKNIREKKGNKSVSLIIWKPWKSWAECNNLYGLYALDTAVSPLLPTFCCSSPSSHSAIPKPSREISKEKPSERQPGIPLTCSRVITLIKILVELVNRNKWLAKTNPWTTLLHSLFQLNLVTGDNMWLRWWEHPLEGAGTTVTTPCTDQAEQSAQHCHGKATAATLEKGATNCKHTWVAGTWLSKETGEGKVWQGLRGERNRFMLVFRETCCLPSSFEWCLTSSSPQHSSTSGCISNTCIATTVNKFPLGIFALWSHSEIPLDRTRVLHPKPVRSTCHYLYCWEIPFLEIPFTLRTTETQDIASALQSSGTNTTQAWLQTTVDIMPERIPARVSPLSRKRRRSGGLFASWHHSILSQSLHGCC